MAAMAVSSVVVPRVTAVAAVMASVPKADLAGPVTVAAAAAMAVAPAAAAAGESSNQCPQCSGT